jgi:hypothetical protein
MSNSTADSTLQLATQVNITLPDTSYEPAAMAVLAGLYQVEPWSKLLTALTPKQQVQAAVLADMWQLTAASDAAVGVLQEATRPQLGGLSKASAVLEQLLSITALPTSLMPLFNQALLRKYSNLEVVWGLYGGALQESLLDLPLHAMELLLASDKLKVRPRGDSCMQCTVAALRTSIVAYYISHWRMGCAHMEQTGQVTILARALCMGGGQQSALQFKTSEILQLLIRGG